MLYIMRHGRTLYQGRLKNYTYPPAEKINAVSITKTGEKIVRQTARQLPRFDIIFCSDIKRTYQTAKIVQEITKSGPIIKDKLLRDTHLGIYHDRPKKEYYDQFPRPEIVLKSRPPGGDSWGDVWARLEKFVKKIDSDKNILIVSHGDPLWLMQGILKKWTIQKTYQKKENFLMETGQARCLR
jgi:broad specificity phosphatase PhoE